MGFADKGLRIFFKFFFFRMGFRNDAVMISFYHEVSFTLLFALSIDLMEFTFEGFEFDFYIIDDAMVMAM